MPQSFTPRKKRRPPSFKKLYKPTAKLVHEASALQSKGDRPLKMEFEDQLKALIFYHLEEHTSGRHLIQVLIATDRRDLAAEQVAEVYKLRWEIESFFAWWKRHLKVYHLIVGSWYGLMVQIYAGLITYLLPAIYCHTTMNASALNASASCEYKSRTNCVNPAVPRMNIFSKNNRQPGYMQKPNRTTLNIIARMYKNLIFVPPLSFVCLTLSISMLLYVWIDATLTAI